MTSIATANTETLERPANRAARVAVRTASAAGWTVVIVGALLLLVPVLMGLDRYVITGNSMQPTFDRGSVIFSRPVPVADLQVGDVITYQPPPATHVDQLVTHRITSIEPGDDGRPVFQTQGDANADIDPWTFQLAADTQNVVQHHVPLVGHLLTFLSDPSNRVVIIGVPAGLIALRALADLARAAFGRTEADEEATPSTDPEHAGDTPEPIVLPRPDAPAGTPVIDLTGAQPARPRPQFAHAGHAGRTGHDAPA